MRNFVQQLSSDVRSGRETWRVFVAAASVSFGAAALNAAIRAAHL